MDIKLPCVRCLGNVMISPSSFGKLVRRFWLRKSDFKFLEIFNTFCWSKVTRHQLSAYWHLSPATRSGILAILLADMSSSRSPWRRFSTCVWVLCWASVLYCLYDAGCWLPGVECTDIPDSWKPTLPSSSHSPPGPSAGRMLHYPSPGLLLILLQQGKLPSILRGNVLLFTDSRPRAELGEAALSLCYCLLSTAAGSWTVGMIIITHSHYSQ